MASLCRLLRTRNDRAFAWREISVSRFHLISTEPHCNFKMFVPCICPLFERERVLPRISSICPTSSTTVARINPEMKIVHHRVFDQKQTTVRDFFWLTEPSRIYCPDFEFLLEERLRRSQQGSLWADIKTHNSVWSHHSGGDDGGCY